MSVKKYLIIPGKVRSKTDGEIHYVSAGKLMYLYGVVETDCVIYDNSKAERLGIEVYERLNEKLFENLIRLSPKSNGIYKTP